MTLEKLLSKLRGDYEQIGTVLKVLTPYVENSHTARKLLKHVKHVKIRKRKHWTQTAKGRERMRQIARRQHAQSK